MRTVWSPVVAAGSVVPSPWRLLMPPHTSSLSAEPSPCSIRTAVQIRQAGARATAIVVDVSDRESVAAGLVEVSQQVEAIDVLINNAGVGGGEPVQASDINRWRRALDVNLFGMYLVTRACLPLMPDRSRIINMSSVLGRFGVPGYTAYCASKHGVIGFTRALALELAPRRITVNALVPGWVATDMAVEGMTTARTRPNDF